jgi:hypothetical protein
VLESLRTSFVKQSINMRPYRAHDKSINYNVDWHVFHKSRTPAVVETMLNRKNLWRAWRNTSSRTKFDAEWDISWHRLLQVLSVLTVEQLHNSAIHQAIIIIVRFFFLQIFLGVSGEY